MQTSQKVISIIICLFFTSNYINSNGYSFKDRTSSSKSTLNGYSGNTVKRKINNSGAGGGASGMPVSKFGASKGGSNSNKNGGYKNPGNLSGGGNSAPQNSSNNLNDMTKILQLLQSQPQMMNNFQNAMSSGNAQQKNLLLTTLMSLISGNSGNSTPQSKPAEPAAPQMPSHCMAPKLSLIHI